jgi:DNA invertase Pin-like site-specific DNA recombinase
MRSKGRCYSTAGENHGLHALSLETVKEIRKLYTGKKGEQKELALKFNIAKSTVHNIVNNKAWRNI